MTCRRVTTRRSVGNHERASSTLSAPLSALSVSLLDEYVWRFKRLDRSPTTITYYTGTIQRFLRERGHVPLEETDPTHIENYLYKRPLSVRSMRTELGVLRNFFQFLVRSKRALPTNPCDAVELPRWRQTKRPSVSFPEFQRLMAACQTTEERLLVALPYCCSFRVSELRFIRRCDVDLEQHRITVLGKGRKHSTVPYPADLTPWLTLQFDGQGATENEDQAYLFPARQWVGRPRQVRWIEDTLKRLGAAVGPLREEQEAQRERRRLLGAAYAIDLDLVFCLPNGRPFHVGNLTRRDFRKVLERAKLPQIRFHDLRHGTATLHLARGVHPKIVQEILGHSTIKVTMDTYSHALPAMQREAQVKLGEWLVK